MKEQPSVQIELDAPRVVLRSGGNSDADGESALLSGNLVVRLLERTGVKDIHMAFNGRAKMAYNDGPPSYKNHSQDIPLYHHTFSFLPEHSNVKGKDHSHTLNAGVHKFPFQLEIPPDLPPTLRSYTGAAIVDYRLKAVVVRSGFASANLSVKKPVLIMRGVGSDAMEFTSTVELDNTWPGKAQYLFTLPHKAHAAGEDIPVSIRFVPLAKGVRLRSVHTEIRESLTIFGKGDSQHTESHCILTHKSDLSDHSHLISRAPSRAPSEPLSRIPSHTQLSGMSSISPGAGSPGVGTPHSTVSGGVAAHDLTRRLAKISARDNEQQNSGNFLSEGRSPPTFSSLGSASRNDPQSQFVQRVQETLEPEPVFEPLDPDDVPPEEAHIVLHLRIPKYACPSNTTQPCVVSHRIKWTCQIENRDLHVSELRCALPIIVLDPCFADEVRLATSGARNLLFGPSGVLVPENEAILQSDLPAYESHTQDRIANSQVAAAPSSYQMNPWASGDNTPATTPFPSRPPSPDAGASGSRSNADDIFGAETHNPYFPTVPSTQSVPDAHVVSSRLLSGQQQASNSRPSTPAATADSTSTPTAGPSASGSASQSSNTSSAGSGSGHGSSHLFSLHMPKPKARRPFSSLGRSAPSSGQSSVHGHSPSGHREDPGPATHHALSLPTTPMNMPSTAPSSPTFRPRSSLHRSSTGGLTPMTPMTPMTPNPNPQNGEGPEYHNVPPYDLARDWLGGGVVPLSSIRGLPSYEECASTPNTAPPSRAGSPVHERPTGNL